MTSSQHVYEARPRKDHCGVDLISDALPFGRLWYTKPDYAIGYAEFYSRSHDAVIRVYDDAGNVIETHQHVGDFKVVSFANRVETLRRLRLPERWLSLLSLCEQWGVRK
jgi:hypothetical protein